MKRVLVIFLFVSTNIFSQPLFQEDFNYPVGNSLTSPWSNSSVIPVYINEGNLTYPGYNSDPGSSRIFLNYNNNNTALSASFSTISTGMVYCSFLVNLNSVLELSTTTSATTNYFFYFGGLSLYRAYLFIRKSGDNSYRIGIGNKFSSTPEYVPVDLAVNATNLIVAGYSFSGGTESASLWINPDLSGPEPAPDATVTLQAIGSVSKIILHQQTLTGDMYIDAIRVADSWSQAPLPVELVSFSAALVTGQVELKWNTKTEVNNYGFEVERSRDKQVWESIGFVNGAGNSNSEKWYSFFDKPGSSNVCYRLKQIDTDGSYTYSHVIEAILKTTGYELFRNYPNPFNPETKIRYSVSERGVVIIKIFDLLGNEVDELVNADHEPGEYSVNFNGKKLCSGLYIYCMRVNEFSKSEIMIFEK